MAIKLGDKAKDVYTGFVGIVVARTEWLYGCTRLSLESTELKDGKPVGLETFDEQRIELHTEAAPIVVEGSEAPRGGPYPDPTR